MASRTDAAWTRLWPPVHQEYTAFGEAGKEHLKAKKVKAEMDKVAAWAVAKMSLARWDFQSRSTRFCLQRQVVAKGCWHGAHACAQVALLKQDQCLAQVQEELAGMEKNKCPGCKLVLDLGLRSI